MPDVITVSNEALDPSVIDPANPPSSQATGPIDLTTLDYNFVGGPSGRLDQPPFETDLSSASPGLTTIGFRVAGGELQIEPTPAGGDSTGLLRPFAAPYPQNNSRFLGAAGRITSLWDGTSWLGIALLVQWRWSPTKSITLAVIPGLQFSPSTSEWRTVTFAFVLKNESGVATVEANTETPDPLPAFQPGPESAPTAYSFLLEWGLDVGFPLGLYVATGTPSTFSPYTMFQQRVFFGNVEAALLDGETGPLPEPDYVGLFIPEQFINGFGGIEVSGGTVSLLRSGRFVNGTFTNAAGPASATSAATGAFDWVMAVPPATTTDLCDVKLQDGPLLRDIRDGFVRGEQVGC